MKKLIIPFLLILTLCSCVADGPAEIEPLNASINGEPVTWEEVIYFEENHKAEVMTKFIMEYDAVPDDDFWETPINGETPQQYLNNLIKEKIIKSKIQLVLCRENKIYDNISIENFYSMKEAYNKTFAENQTIGINKIPDKYYDYYIDNGVMELKNILEKSTLAPTENEIKNKMISVKEKYPDKTEDEQLSIAKDILVEEKYDTYIEKLCSQAEVDWGSFR
ncbi:MAG: hypothetical protein IJZ57_05030 [Clostridia bacterium]|nr:hypothetical protein [Clostridia bacterium]